MRGLKGKTAIVTGGAAGIGAAIVARFREEGTKVVPGGDRRIGGRRRGRDAW